MNSADKPEPASDVVCAVALIAFVALVAFIAHQRRKPIAERTFIAQFDDQFVCRFTAVALFPAERIEPILLGTAITVLFGKPVRRIALEKFYQLLEIPFESEFRSVRINGFEIDGVRVLFEVPKYLGIPLYSEPCALHVPGVDDRPGGVVEGKFSADFIPFPGSEFVGAALP